MDLKFLSLATLVLAALCCVFYATGHQIYEFDRDDMVFGSSLI